MHAWNWKIEWARSHIGSLRGVLFFLKPFFFSLDYFAIETQFFCPHLSRTCRGLTV